MEVEIRRRRQTLYYSGRAFIIFGVWSVIKIFVGLYLDPIDWVQLFGQLDVDISGVEQEFNLILYLTMGIFASIAILLRLYIGLSAIGEGKGKKKRIFYVIFAVVYFFVILLSYIPSSDDADYLIGSILTTVILDVTSLISLVAIIINSYKLRKLVE